MSDIGSLKSVKIKLISFGFKYGYIKSDTVFDVRFIKNPYFIERMRNSSGLDEETYQFVISQNETKIFINDIMNLIKDIVPFYKAKGVDRVKMAIGCTGGRHRSVAVVKYMGQKLRDMGVEVEIEHRDINRGIYE